MIGSEKAQTRSLGLFFVGDPLGAIGSNLSNAD
jgi:hypothetical protein